MSNTRLYWLHTLSPTHVGTGRGVGYIDLPIHRDKVTNWPLIPGSAFKGVWADCYGASDDNRKEKSPEGRLLRAAFGLASDEGQNNSNAGALIPTDARLVCLPVRSFQGTFAWCTSALLLNLLRRDLEMAGIIAEQLPPCMSDVHEGQLAHPAGTALKQGSQVLLEELSFVSDERQEASDWAKHIAGWVFPGDTAWQAEFTKRFAVLPDVEFDYLAETGTEVSARVKIADESKTVAKGQLWNEESLPAETILAGQVFCDRVYGKDLNGITKEMLIERFATGCRTLQIGGKATVGRGRVRCVFTQI